jgi:RNA polymerase-binding transcription factor DksA
MEQLGGLMVTDLYERIQEGLEEKQKEIIEFLEKAPETEKEICLCDDEDTVEEHLHVIETSLEKIEDQSLGVCVVCHGHVDAVLLEMDYTAAVCLDHYSDEERRRLEAELELSQVVQRALLPQRMPNIRGVELAAFSRPSEIIVPGWHARAGHRGCKRTRRLCRDADEQPANCHPDHGA